MFVKISKASLEISDLSQSSTFISGLTASYLLGTKMKKKKIPEGNSSQDMWGVKTKTQDQSEEKLILHSSSMLNLSLAHQIT